MKNPPKGFVVLWIGEFGGSEPIVPETSETLAVLIPRSDVATLEVSVRHVQVFWYVANFT
jgi:hypothetical protein